MFRPSLILRIALSALLATSVSASIFSSEPDVVVTAAFPEDNPFGLVVNGQRNKIALNVENHSSNNITLVSVGGSFHDPVSEALIRNTTTSSLVGLVVPATGKLQVPYTFHSEFKPKDLKLNLWVDYLDGANKWRVPAFDGIVTIVEPPASIFDLQLIGTYLLLGALLGGASYWAYTTYFPQKKARRARAPRPVEVSSPVGKVTASNSTGTYQEEWIPEHHLRKSKKKAADGTTSGAETSGAESEGTKKRRSSRRRG